MSFAPFLPKDSPHTIHRAYVQESTSFLPKGIGNNAIFLFQKCYTFEGPQKEEPSQHHPDYTPLIWSSSTKTRIIDSQKLNYLKTKAIAFSRNPHLLLSNPLFRCRGIMTCFRPSEPKPSLTCADAYLIHQLNILKKSNKGTKVVCE